MITKQEYEKAYATVVQYRIEQKLTRVNYKNNVCSCELPIVVFNQNECNRCGKLHRNKKNHTANLCAQDAVDELYNAAKRCVSKEINF